MGWVGWGGGSKGQREGGRDGGRKEKKKIGQREENFWLSLNQRL